MIKIKQEAILDLESMAASFESEAIDILYFRGYSISLIFTGSPVGTAKLQISNDTEEPSNWVDLTDSSVSITEAGSIVYEVTESFSSFVKVVYTRSSGSGSMSGNITAKG